jgi:hypothetical protein
VDNYGDNSPPDDSASTIALQQEVAALMARWQQAGVSPYEIAMVLATAGYRMLGHAVGPIAPPEGPELIQHIAQQLQREAESSYFEHWRG